MDWDKWEKEFEAKMAKLDNICNGANISQIVNSNVTTSCDGKTYVDGKEYIIPKNAHKVSICNGVVKVNGKVISPVEENKKEDIKEFKLKNSGPSDPLDEDNDLSLTNLYLRKYDMGHIYKKDDKIYWAKNDNNINPIDITASDTIKRDFEEMNREFGQYNFEDFTEASKYNNLSDPENTDYYDRLCEGITGRKLFNDNNVCTHAEGYIAGDIYNTPAEGYNSSDHLSTWSCVVDNSRFPADASCPNPINELEKIILFDSVTYDGHKIPKCPGMICNSSGEVTNIVETKDAIYCNGYQLIEGEWKKNFKAKLKCLFK